jgi:cytochrome c553
MDLQEENETMSKMRLLTLIVALLVLPDGAALAEGSVAAGKRKSEDCADCHGPAGAGDGDTIPRIAGMSVEKFVKAIQDFESGVRKSSPMMVKQGHKLSDADVADLAAYYSQLEP